MYFRWIKLARRRLDVCSCWIYLWCLVLIMEFCTVAAQSPRRPSSRQLTPKFLPSPTNITVHKGEFAELRCHIRNLGPKMTVVWRKANENSPLTIGERTFAQRKEISVAYEKLSKSDTKWNLLIKNVQPRHAGVYECAISAKGIYTHYVALNVLNTPVKHKPELRVTGTEYVNQYNEIHLTCNATGDDRAPEDVEWFFNGDKIHTSHPHWYGRTETLNHRPIPGRSFISELIIHQSTTADQGNYVCRSSDLGINSLIVHILNADRDTDIVPRAPGEESESMTSVDADTNAASRPLSATHSIIQYLIVFTCLLYMNQNYIHQVAVF